MANARKIHGSVGVYIHGLLIIISKFFNENINRHPSVERCRNMLLVYTLDAIDLGAIFDLTTKKVVRIRSQVSTIVTTIAKS